MAISLYKALRAAIGKEGRFCRTSDDKLHGKIKVTGFVYSRHLGQYHLGVSATNSSTMT